MIKKKRVYIADIAKSKFVDRLFYYLLNHLRLDIRGKSYMTINPLKWSVMTVIASLWVVFFYLVVFPIIGIPAVVYGAYKMPKKYNKDEGWFVKNVWLLRDIS